MPAGGYHLAAGRHFQRQDRRYLAGYVLADGSILTSDEAGHHKTCRVHPPVQVVGTDGRGEWTGT